MSVPGWNEELHVPDYALPYVHASVCVYARALVRRKKERIQLDRKKIRMLQAGVIDPLFFET